MKMSQIIEEINQELKSLIGFKGYLSDMNELVKKACIKVFF